jgi:hypothetical protein
MKRSLSLVSAVSLALAISLPARHASAGGNGVQVAVFKIRDKSLNAVFETADGCFVATTTIRYAASVTQESGPPVAQPPLTQVEVAYSNGCTGEFFDLTGGTNVQTVNIAQNLSSATLSAVVPVTDGVVNANVTINARFKKDGPLQEAKDHSVTYDPDARSITIERFDFKVQPANMTGTSITTVLPLQAGPTFLELATDPVSGQMGKDVFGQRTVTFLPRH